MIGRFGLLVDLDRCVGCYACEVGCKEWNNVPGDQKWIKIEQIGPQMLNGKLKMDFFPLVMDGCNFCKSNPEGKLGPFCVSVCPTQALRFCETAEISKLLNMGMRYQICKLGA